jgi:hypothetical protein
MCFVDMKTFPSNKPIVNVNIFRGVHVFAFGIQMKNFHCVFSSAAGVSGV